MKKKIICLLLALMMVGQFAMTAFAASYFDNVNTSANLQITTSGTPITAETQDHITVTKYDSEAFPEFDYLCTLNIENVRSKFTEYYTNWATLLGMTGADADTIAALNARVENMQITGDFTVEITYPNSLTIPAAFLANGTMAGFDNNAKLIFGNDTRTVIAGADTSTLKIEVEIVGKDVGGTRPGYILAKDLMDNVNDYLCDLSLLCEDIATTQYGTFTVSGKMTGFTIAADSSTTLRVDYQTDPEWDSATCTVEKRSGRLYPTTDLSDNSTITFYVDGKTDVVAPITKADGTQIEISDLTIPYRDGYSFNGWYTDANLTNKVTEGFRLEKNIALYGSFTQTSTPNKLNDVDHFAYIIGYPDGTVKPEGFITREEVATIFFRLLNEEYRNEILSKINNFTDVDAERWSNTAISTLTNDNILKGYGDGTFGPGNFITRAEFTAIASRLDTSIEGATHNFTDISGHWAEGYIANAVAKGWITGYENNTFRPEQNITRAEAMTTVNRILRRFVDSDKIHEDSIDWPDNPEDAWYYLAVIEATNGHDYDRANNSIYESWSSLRENPDWSALEQ